MEFPSLYTDHVKSCILWAKTELPADFSLTTVEREIYGGGTHDTIVIQIDSREFDWRTVEDRLHIAVTLEKLKELIRAEGVPCLIEKPETE